MSKRFVPVTWSYSTLTNFEACPRKFFHLYERKDVVEPESQPIQMGNEVHRIMEAYVKTNKPVPAGLQYLAWVADQVRADALAVETEQSLALSDELKPVPFRSYEACWRGKADLTVIRSDGVWVVDYKSGKPVKDDLQLRLLALAVLQANPEQPLAYCLYAYMNRQLHSVIVRRDEAEAVVDAVNPRLEALMNARKMQHWPENPGRHCRWCPVLSCVHNENEQPQAAYA